MSTFGKLQQVDLRNGWAHEALNFTTWLIKDENLSKLADEIGIEITPIDAEVKTGRYSVDILAEEEGTGNKVVIENQLESTDHDHLGKIITYASGLDATYIVWIVKNANEEHRQALEWLNENTGNQLNFFLLRLELWKIDNSLPAVKLNTIVKPNEWTKTIRERSKSEELTETRLMQLDFWKQFKAYCNEQYSHFATQKALPRNWYTIRIGKSDCKISLTINTRDNEIGCDLYIRDSKELFDSLYKRKDEIEDSISHDLQWQRLDEKKASRIKLSRSVDIYDEENWSEYHKWLYDQAVKFKQVFGA